MKKKNFDKNIISMSVSFVILVIGIILIVESNYTNVSSNNKNVTIITTAPNITKKVVEMYLPAVDNEGNGVTTKLTVEIRPGEGRTLVDVNGLLFWVDTQQSIQTAKYVAEKITGINVSKYDIIYSIASNSTLVEGPSAGAAITIATIAALEGKNLNKSVMITGTINRDGTIGQVGGIIPKAKASKDTGAKIFLVPEGQSTQVNYIPNEKCEKVGSFTFCTTTYKEEKENVGKIVGINVTEVGTIQDAMKYFFG